MLESNPSSRDCLSPIAPSIHKFACGSSKDMFPSQASSSKLCSLKPPVTSAWSQACLAKVEEELTFELVRPITTTSIYQRKLRRESRNFRVTELTNHQNYHHEESPPPQMTTPANHHQHHHKSPPQFFGFFPQTLCLTLGVLTVTVTGRGVRSEVANGFRRKYRTIVLRCSFFVVIFVLSRCRRAAGTGFACEFSWFPALQLLQCSFFVVIFVLSGRPQWTRTGCSW